MTTEDEILKVLRKLDAALSSNTIAGGLGRAPVSPRGAGTQQRQSGSQDPTMSVQARKSFQATTAAMNTLNESSRTLNRTFTGLNKTVLNTRANFVEMNRSMRAYSRNATTANVTGGQERVPAGVDATGGLPRSIVRMLENVLDSRDSPIRDLTNTLRNQARPVPQAVPTNRPNRTQDQVTEREERRQRRRQVVIDRGMGNNRGLIRILSRTFGPRAGDPNRGRPGAGGGGGNRNLDNLINIVGGPRGPGGRLGNALDGLSGRVNVARVGFVSAILALSAAVVPLVNDILHLHSVGIQASSALGGLYVDAARSGMSLQEYTKVLQEASPAVSRAGSMADFNKTLQVSRDRLAGLGIFGEEATKLSASMANSATVLGIPQANLANATNAQIESFERLRKSSLITAEQFQELTAQLGGQQEVQSQLLGMAPAERAARLSELTNMKTFGLELGGSKAAAEAFGDALIKQRNLTAPQRFEAAGRIRQAGAMFGMEGADTERLARLSRQKNFQGQDREDALRLGRQLQERIERGMNSGNIQQEYLAEQAQAQLDSSGIGNLLRTAGNLGMTTDSGQAGVNKDFAKGSSDLLIATGQLMSWIKGINANPVAGAIITALGSAAFGLGLGAIISRVITRRPGMPGGPEIPGGPRRGRPVPVPDRLGGGPPAPPGAGNGPGRLGGLRNLRGLMGRAGSIGLVFEIITKMGSLSTYAPILTRTGQAIAGASSAFGAAIRTAGAGLASGGKTLFDMAKVIPASVGNLVNSVRASFQFLRATGMNSVKAAGLAVFDVVKGLGGVFSGASGGLGAALSGGFLKVIGGAFRFVMGSGVLSGIFGGIMELFTGELGSALNAPDDTGWFDNGLKGLLGKLWGKIGDIVGGFLRGFLTGITGLGDLLIDTWNWTVGSFFDGLKINLSSSLTNLVDQMWTSMIITFKEMKLKVAKALGMSDTAKEIEADIKVAKETQKKLKEGGDTTLTTIGDANQQLLSKQKDAAEKTKNNVGSAAKSIDTASGVVTSTKNLTETLLRDAANIRGAQAKAADAVVNPTPIAATPGSTPRAGVIDPAVNKPAEAATAPTPAAGETGTGPAAATPMEMLAAQFATMNQLLTQMLGAEQAQAAGLDGLARSLGKPGFTDTDFSLRALNGA